MRAAGSAAGVESRGCSSGHALLGTLVGLVATILSLQSSRDQAVEKGTIFGENARNVAGSLANDLTDALDGFAQQMIQQQIAFNIVREMLSAVGMGASSVASAGGSWLSQAMVAGFHGGAYGRRRGAVCAPD